MITIERNVHAGFWRGFGSALTTRRVRFSPLVFKFRGQDILTITSEQAIQQDWSTFGTDFQGSVRKIAEHEQSGAGVESESDLVTR